MDIFEFAKKMEKDGEKFYRDLAEMSVDKGINKIWGTLADAEVLHYNAILEMEKQQEIKLPSTKILENIKNLFSGIKPSRFDPNFSFPEIDIYKQALEIEKQSQDFYEQKAAEIPDEKVKSLFLKIALEEKQHYFLVDNIIEFMQRPFRWLENAEWNHLEDY